MTQEDSTVAHSTIMIRSNKRNNKLVLLDSFFFEFPLGAIMTRSPGQGSQNNVAGPW